MIGDGKSKTSDHSQNGFAECRQTDPALLRAYPIISFHRFRERRVGRKGGSNRCWFSQLIATFTCPHPNPLPEGEGELLGIGSNRQGMGYAQQFPGEHGLLVIPK